MINISLISNIFKIKYDFLNEKMAKLSRPSKEGLKNQVLMVIDIGKVIEMLMAIVEKKNLVVTKKHKGLIFIAVLNIVAHYRHYFSNELHLTNSFILYCSDPENYENYKDIIKDLYNFAKYIPNFNVIDKMDSKSNKYVYVQAVAYLIDLANRNCKLQKKTLQVVSLCGNSCEYQFLNITNNIYWLSRTSGKYVLKIEDILHGYLLDDRVYSIKYNYHLTKLIYPILFYFRILRLDDYKMSDKGERIKRATRGKLVFEFLDLNKDLLNIRPINELFGEFLSDINVTKEDIETCGNLMNKLYYYNNIPLKEVMKTNLKAWNTKLHDKNLMNINEYSELMNENNILILWLNEYRGQ